MRFAAVEEILILIQIAEINRAFSENLQWKTGSPFGANSSCFLRGSI